MLPRCSQEVSLPWSHGSTVCRVRFCIPHGCCSPLPEPSMHRWWLSAPHGSELQPAGANRGSEGLMEHLGVHKLCTVVFVGWPFLPSWEASADQSSYGCFSALHLCLSFPSSKDRASSGSWNTTAQHSWPGSFSNCIYGGCSQT